MSIKCLKCGEPLTPEMKKCPKCGSGDRHVTFTDSCKALITVGVKQRAEGYHKFKKYLKHGEKISKTGKLAIETLIIDKEAKQKHHLVKEQDNKGEWVVVHKEDEPLGNYYDIEFEGKKFKREEFRYYPFKEPNKRMKYCAAFWELWKTKKGIIGKEWKRGKLYELSMEFRKNFNELYRERKKERKPITWDDFKNLEL